MNIPTKIKIQAGVKYWFDCQYSTDNGVTWNKPSDTEIFNEDDVIVKGDTIIIDSSNK